MPKALKRGALRAFKTLGLFDAARNSQWRTDRLLILCYHGVSLDDEHEWDGAYYMSATAFEDRLRTLSEGGYSVLPLSEAVQRLYARTLPERSVVLTFDDGLSDFAQRAYPLLRKYGFPATVYLTTYYCRYNKPVFGMFCSYVLWKARGRIVDPEGLAGASRGERWDLRSDGGRAEAHRAILRYADEQGLSAEQKNDLAERLCRRLGVDYDALAAKRLLHLMTPEEVSALAREGVDFQLHTHRHRTPRDRALFLREIADNLAQLRDLTGSEAAHFCYPSGVHRPEFLPWLEECGVVSATTCESKLASSDTSPLLLPRMVDTSNIAPVEFESWLTGVGGLLPRRSRGEGRMAPR